MDWVSKVLEGRIATKIVALVLAASAGLLFLPGPFIARLRLDEFLQDYGKYVGVAFLLSSGLLAVDFLAWAFKAVKERRRKAKNEADLLASVVESVLGMDDDEKAVMREFYLQGKNTIQLPADQHVVAGLLKKGIISLVGPKGKASRSGVLFPVCISPRAKGFIDEQVLGFPEINGEPTEVQKESILGSRPPFIWDIVRHNRLWGD